MIRHSKRDKANEFGEKEMKSWWKEKDFLGGNFEKVIHKDMSLNNVVEMICNDISFKDSEGNGLDSFS